MMSVIAETNVREGALECEGVNTVSLVLGVCVSTLSWLSVCASPYNITSFYGNLVEDSPLPWLALPRRARADPVRKPTW